MVLDQFFQMYHLPQARACLKEWLDDALRAEDNCASAHVTMYNQVEKLIEAAFILHNGYELKEEPGQLKDTSLTPHLVNPEASPGQTLKENQFRRGHSLIDRVRKAPEANVKEIFRLVGPEDLKAVLHLWVKVSLSNDPIRYTEAKMKGQLIEFSYDVTGLIEAVYLMSEIKDLAEAIGREELPPGLKKDLRKDRSFAHLTAAQIDMPKLVLTAFFEKFSLEHCQTALWNLLDSAITYKEQLPDEPHRANLLLYYECYLSVIEVAWAINNVSKRRQQESSGISDAETTQE